MQDECAIASLVGIPVWVALVFCLLANNKLECFFRQKFELVFISLQIKCDVCVYCDLSVWLTYWWRLWTPLPPHTHTLCFVYIPVIRQREERTVLTLFSVHSVRWRLTFPSDEGWSGTGDSVVDTPVWTLPISQSILSSGTAHAKGTPGLFFTANAHLVEWVDVKPLHGSFKTSRWKVSP